MVLIIICVPIRIATVMAFRGSALTSGNPGKLMFSTMEYKLIITFILV